MNKTITCLFIFSFLHFHTVECKEYPQFTNSYDQKKSTNNQEYSISDQQIFISPHKQSANYNKKLKNYNDLIVSKAVDVTCTKTFLDSQFEKPTSNRFFFLKKVCKSTHTLDSIGFFLSQDINIENTLKKNSATSLLAPNLNFIDIPNYISRFNEKSSRFLSKINLLQDSINPKLSLNKLIEKRAIIKNQSDHFMKNAYLVGLHIEIQHPSEQSGMLFYSNSISSPRNDKGQSPMYSSQVMLQNLLFTENTENDLEYNNLSIENIFSDLDELTVSEYQNISNTQISLGKNYVFYDTKSNQIFQGSYNSISGNSSEFESSLIYTNIRVPEPSIYFLIGLIFSVIETLKKLNINNTKLRKLSCD